MLRLMPHVLPGKGLAPGGGTEPPLIGSVMTLRRSKALRTVWIVPLSIDPVRDSCTMLKAEDTDFRAAISSPWKICISAVSIRARICPSLLSVRRARSLAALVTRRTLRRTWRRAQRSHWSSTSGGFSRSACAAWLSEYHFRILARRFSASQFIRAIV